MDFPFVWSADVAEANRSIILATLGFIVFWFAGQSPLMLQHLTNRYGYDRGQAYQIFLKRVIGMCCLGVIPALVMLNSSTYSWADYGIAAKFLPEVFYWAGGLSLVIVFITARTARQPAHLEQFPEIRMLPWRNSLLVWSALSWVGYLIAYELLFRGFLLFACARAFGAWPAVLINTSMYALVHLPKGPNEGIGAIPLGLLLCYITLQTETVWVALLVHVVLALSNEWYSLKYRLAK
ncbi:MAG: CPBP family intramembrane metalloprotease [Saprospirales bacterium]|nr:CPBP family intramembrane metalloprotease [Saprospirales bacterium]MBK8922299.1 CPBP family intramembrane metalloprotease [Saprospirales bacterium]